MIRDTEVRFLWLGVAVIVRLLDIEAARTLPAIRLDGPDYPCFFFLLFCFLRAAPIAEECGSSIRALEQTLSIWDCHFPAVSEQVRFGGQL